MIFPPLSLGPKCFNVLTWMGCRTIDQIGWAMKGPLSVNSMKRSEMDYYNWPVRHQYLHLLRFQGRTWAWIWNSFGCFTPNLLSDCKKKKGFCSHSFALKALWCQRWRGQSCHTRYGTLVGSKGASPVADFIL